MRRSERSFRPRRGPPAPRRPGGGASARRRGAALVACLALLLLLGGVLLAQTLALELLWRAERNRRALTSATALAEAATALSAALLRDAHARHGRLPETLPPLPQPLPLPLAELVPGTVATEVVATYERLGDHRGRVRLRATAGVSRVARELVFGAPGGRASDAPGETRGRGRAAAGSPVEAPEELPIELPDDSIADSIDAPPTNAPTNAQTTPPLDLPAKPPRKTP